MVEPQERIAVDIAAATAAPRKVNVSVDIPPGGLPPKNLGRP
jgi:hypothetical protein